MIYEQIRAALEGEHPVLTEQVNGEVRTLTDAERAALLDRWAAAQWAAMQPTPAEQLAAARTAMAAILDALPVADRAVVLPIRTSVEAALDRGDVELALYTVQTAAVPGHLEPTRTAILDLFPAP